MLLSLRTFRTAALVTVFLLAVQGGAQTRQQDGAFGTKFFDDLRSLFGRLQQADLDRAFDRAKELRCSDMVDQSGEWKEVAFLNEDRKLGNWHFDNIEDVKADLTKFVFSSDCRGQDSRLTVATSYPVQESMDRLEKGRIALSQVTIIDNAPVKVTFESSDRAAVFELPYVYVDTNKAGPTPVYTLAPPLTTSKRVPGLAIGFRCKAVSDVDPTYLFMLCQTQMIDHNVPAPRPGARVPLGNAAYYILSDGKEASSSVKLVFGNVDDAIPGPQPAAPSASPSLKPAAADDNAWHPAAPEAKLQDVSEQTFRLRFNPQSWKDRIDKPQIITGQAISGWNGTSPPNRDQQYCVWRPLQASQLAPLLAKENETAFVYSLRLTSNRQSPTTAIFEVENDKGENLTSLQCYFPPQSRTPADITVAQWLSIVGSHIQIEAHGP